MTLQVFHFPPQLEVLLKQIKYFYNIYLTRRGVEMENIFWMYLLAKTVTFTEVQ